MKKEFTNILFLSLAAMLAWCFVMSKFIIGDDPATWPNAIFFVVGALVIAVGGMYKLFAASHDFREEIRTELVKEWNLEQYTSVSQFARVRDERERYKELLDHDEVLISALSILAKHGEDFSHVVPEIFSLWATHLPQCAKTSNRDNFSVMLSDAFVMVTFKINDLYKDDAARNDLYLSNSLTLVALKKALEKQYPKQSSGGVLA